MKHPLISVITPVLNGVKFLELCIKSVLNQNYQFVEHIFIDGGSTDGTIEMLMRYKDENPNRIVLILEKDSKPGSGAGEAWNKGLRIARGDIFGWLGCDDMYQPEAISQIVEFFKLNKDSYFVHGACNYIDEDGKIFYVHQPINFKIKELINKRNFIAFPSAFYKRDVVDKVGSLDEYGNDYDYLIRIAKNFQIDHIDKVLSSFRVHNESETGNAESYIKTIHKDYLISRKHGGDRFSKFGQRYFLFIMIKFLGLSSAYSLYKKVNIRKTC